MAGCKSGTEAEILKEGLSSTRVIGFLAYGELSFTNLIRFGYGAGVRSIDRLTLGFSQYGYNGVNGLLEPSSSIPQDRFESSTPHESWEMKASNLGAYGTGNITLDLLLYLGASYRVYDVLQYDVGLYIGLSMHQRSLIQLTSLNASMYVDRFNGFFVRPP